MANTPDTYGRSIQLGASRRRLEDARVLHSQKRWNGAIYMGGYAIECALKSLICYQEPTNNFKDTTVFKQGLKGSDLHSLIKLLDALPNIQKVIESQKGNNSYRQAWITVTSLWRNDELRYSNKKGDETEANKFLDAVKILHRYLLSKQGES
ncbi:hypothetical protein ACP6PL_27565 [Dapis sp. BLCC M126]|uniref:hypothetical protein n=1 Tax=Dapis sp. BLCC M126 TaxID=3400189 RepID=UPI003CF74CFD